MSYKTLGVLTGIATAIVGAHTWHSYASDTSSADAGLLSARRAYAMHAALPADVTSTTMQHNGPSLQTIEQVRAAWNDVAAQIQPYAIIKQIKQDGSGHLFAQVGTHVFLTGFTNSSGYAFDIMLDHPSTNVRATTEQLLPYWQVLIQMTQPHLSTAQANEIVRKLGLFQRTATVPNRFEVDALKITVEGIQYAVSYTDGLTFSAEKGPTGTDPNRDLDWEYKETSVVGAESNVYPLSRDAIDSELKHGLPSHLTTRVLHGPTPILLSNLQKLAEWTTQQTDLAVPTGTGIPVIPEAAVKDIKADLEHYYTTDFIQHMLHDEIWANWVKGTVVNESFVQTQHTLYGLGRVFIAPEPPFQEGQVYEFPMPLYGDGTTYALASLRAFAQLPASHLKRLTFNATQISVTVVMPQNGTGTPVDNTFTFYWKTFRGQILVTGIRVPPYVGA